MELRGAGDRWLAGEPLPGVAFALHDRVRVTAGRHSGADGTIVLLSALDPEPGYLVRLDPADTPVRVAQSALSRRA
jgi:hypothetical protein